MKLYNLYHLNCLNILQLLNNIFDKKRNLFDPNLNSEKIRATLSRIKIEKVTSAYKFIDFHIVD